MKYMVHRPCPHCGNGSTSRHGSFPLTDGTRRQRWLCGGCGRTFSQTTGTPLYYIKKHRLWPRLGVAMAMRLTIRSTARDLGVGIPTAFRWRHLKLKDLAGLPQPVLTDAVGASEAYIPYSEKGSRKTHGPGSWGYRLASASVHIPRALRFRRFIEGRPSCVLVACDSHRRAVAIVSQGRPDPSQLETALKRLLGDGSRLSGPGGAAYAEACRRLGLPWEPEAIQPGRCDRSSVCERARTLMGSLYGFLMPFRGVATRYLGHYLAWFAATRPGAGVPPAA
jgi:transposase-like protein